MSPCTVVNILTLKKHQDNTGEHSKHQSVLNLIPVDHGASVGGPPRLILALALALALNDTALRRPVTVLVVDGPSVGKASVARAPHIVHSASSEPSVASAAGEASVSSAAAGEASVASASGEAIVSIVSSVVAGLHIEGVPTIVVVVVVVVIV